MIPKKNPRNFKHTGWYVRFKSPFYAAIQSDYWGCSPLSTVMMLEQLRALRGLGMSPDTSLPYWFEAFYVLNGERMP